MTESYEKWESEIDWSKRTSVVGGPIFYDFVKAKAIPALEDGLRQLETAKASCEDRIRRWGCIAERAGKLSDCFAWRENMDALGLASPRQATHRCNARGFKCADEVCDRAGWR